MGLAGHLQGLRAPQGGSPGSWEGEQRSLQRAGQDCPPPCPHGEFPLQGKQSQDVILTRQLVSHNPRGVGSPVSTLYVDMAVVEVSRQPLPGSSVPGPHLAATKGSGSHVTQFTWSGPSPSHFGPF